MPLVLERSWTLPNHLRGYRPEVPCQESSVTLTDRLISVEGSVGYRDMGVYEESLVFCVG